MNSCKAVSTPISTTEKLSSYIGDPLGPNDATNFRSIVGGLQYLTLTQPDLAFVVNKICQYLHAPTMVHLVFAVNKICQYLHAPTMVHLVAVKWILHMFEGLLTWGFVLLSHRPYWLVDF
jgi:hypothetical protein